MVWLEKNFKCIVFSNNNLCEIVVTSKQNGYMFHTSYKVSHVKLTQRTNHMVYYNYILFLYGIIGIPMFLLLLLNCAKLLKCKKKKNSFKMSFFP